MEINFHTFSPETGELHAAPGTVTTYPGGDIAVWKLEPDTPEGIPVAWTHGGALNYQALGQWISYHRHATPDVEPVLVIPFLPSARGDHDPTDDARVAARLTATTGIRHIITADPHSPVWLEEAERHGVKATVLEAADLMSRNVAHAPGWAGVISPDKGARDRAGKAAKQLGVPLYVAGKHRDPATGKLSGFSAPEGLPESGRMVVIDDICDGGGTFGGLQAAIKQVRPEIRLHLRVTHGCFTGKWRENLAGFASITCSDSRTVPDGVHSVPLLPFVLDALASIAAS